MRPRIIICVVASAMAGCAMAPEQRDALAGAAGTLGGIAATAAGMDPDVVREAVEISTRAALDAAAAKAEAEDGGFWGRLAATLSGIVTIAGTAALGILRARNRRSDVRKSDLEEAVANLIEGHRAEPPT